MQRDIKAIETRYKGYRLKRPLTILPSKKKPQSRSDIQGQMFGRLTAKEDLGPDGKGYRYWGCQCSCGELIVARSRELQRGHTRSCGCLFLENLKKSAGRNKLPIGESAFNQLFGGYKKSASERGHAFKLSKDQFRSITELDCHYCGAGRSIKYKGVAGTNGSYYGSGVDRIVNSVGYEEGNVVPCCAQCNFAKGSLNLEDFKAWAMRLAARFEFGESGAR